MSEGRAWGRKPAQGTVLPVARACRLPPPSEAGAPSAVHVHAGTAGSQAAECARHRQRREKQASAGGGGCEQGTFCLLRWDGGLGRRCCLCCDLTPAARVLSLAPFLPLRKASHQRPRGDRRSASPAHPDRQRRRTARWECPLPFPGQFQHRFVWQVGTQPAGVRCYFRV